MQLGSTEQQTKSARHIGVNCVLLDSTLGADYAVSRIPRKSSEAPCYLTRAALREMENSHKVS